MPNNTPLRVSELDQNQPTAFDVLPDAGALREMAGELGLVALKKARLQGKVAPLGKRDWLLTAHLGATVVQECVATLEPVQTRIDTGVERRFIADLDMPNEPEVEMPEDETEEPLGAFIDPSLVLREALALALPLYPRAPDAEAVSIQVTEPGAEALTDETVKPFASLAELKRKMEGGRES